ncbi:hypothetical protein Rhe02_55810 [Rhizocola hellebori]|uniref:Uncharacterized protein n=1 Tax=Rhizocola hellebori TaxID=1392758 RepID=A0A8J3QB30_9ACTN|nr:hypothetical protein [Rhizocola hellebori]GIH07514.1 hypothetical protein Rhe02_55810 [Rhizocola hellebori]
MTNTKPMIWKIEDREFQGECSACPRTGLRWIAVLSDGSTVGLECAKKIVGFRPSPITYTWVADFEPIAEHNDHGTLYVMWQRKGGKATRETKNGALVSVGGVRSDWIKRGWVEN